MHPSTKVKGPGAYNYEDHTRRMSYNKSANPAFLNHEKRFGAADSSSPNKGGPGPGAYFDKDNIDLQHYSGMLLL